MGKIKHGGNNYRTGSDFFERQWFFLPSRYSPMVSTLNINSRQFSEVSICVANVCCFRSSFFAGNLIIT